MIIFDLDGTLANFDHRKRFRDPKCDPNAMLLFDQWIIKGHYENSSTIAPWYPQYQCFHEACDKDSPIECNIKTLKFLAKFDDGDDIQIWTGRCESVRDKTIEWLSKHVGLKFDAANLKMRPIDNREPEHELKEQWLVELLEKGQSVDFAFEDDKKVIDMWKRRNVLVFIS